MATKAGVADTAATRLQGKSMMCGVWCCLLYSMHPARVECVLALEKWMGRKEWCFSPRLGPGQGECDWVNELYHTRAPQVLVSTLDRPVSDVRCDLGVGTYIRRTELECRFCTDPVPQPISGKKKNGKKRQKQDDVDDWRGDSRSRLLEWLCGRCVCVTVT